MKQEDKEIPEGATLFEFDDYAVLMDDFVIEFMMYSDMMFAKNTLMSRFLPARYKLGRSLNPDGYTMPSLVIVPRREDDFILTISMVRRRKQVQENSLFAALGVKAPISNEFETNFTIETGGLGLESDGQVYMIGSDVETATAKALTYFTRSVAEVIRAYSLAEDSMHDNEPLDDDNTEVQ